MSDDKLVVDTKWSLKFNEADVNVAGGDMLDSLLRSRGEVD